MKRRSHSLLAALLAGVSGFVCASNEPHVGFAFPAGAERGQTIDVLIGGQYFSGATNVFISGEGARVEIKRYSVKHDLRQVGRFYRNIENSKATLADEDVSEKQKNVLRKRLVQAEKQLKLLDLPDDVDPFNKKEVQRYYRSEKKEQFNPQLSDRLRVRVVVDAAAPPGERELRVYTPAGLSNPVYFQVGTLQEAYEEEPNDDHMSPDLKEVPVPSVINGQVRPGDIDHFRFQATKGDSIVVDVAARRVIPYLADAVPGWFQAVVALYDENGNEVAYQDDYKFNPDPVLFFDVPETGSYTLSIRDSIYRGREDFIYRIAIGELPFITGIFPLGAREGAEVDIALSGRNLPQTRLSGKLPKNGYETRHVSVRKDGYRSNQMPFAIGDVGEVFEIEPNGTPTDAQAVKHPLIINGRVQQVGDRDVYAVQGRKGETVSIEVIARRLNSPLDSVITLSGPGLDKPERNDDNVSKDKTHLYLGAGLITHHADSYLLHEFPETGTYYVEIADAQNKGGHDYGYRLRISESNPDFQLRMEPSGMHIAPGATAAFTVRATRKDGFDKRIVLGAAELPDGFAMSETVIPKGSDTARFTITAPKQIEGKMVSPTINGTGIINGSPVIRQAVPVDDQMQAFLYRHLVPAKELVLAPVDKRPPIVFHASVPKSGVIELEAGTRTRVRLEGNIVGPGKGFGVKLDHPPEGFSIAKNGWIGVQKGKGGAKTSAVGNLLIDVDASVAPGTKLSLVVFAEAKQGRDTVRYPAPAIPIKVVKPKNQP